MRNDQNSRISYVQCNHHLPRLPESKTLNIPLKAFIAVCLMIGCALVQAQVFWSVESPQGQRSWLLGTVHSEDPRLLDFPPALNQALDEAEVLALELMPDAGILGKLSEAMHLPGDERLDELIEPDLYEQVVKILEQYGMGEPAVRRLRPWAAAVTVSVPPPETGLFMDLALAFRAGGLGTEVISLETVEEQLDFLTGLGREAHIEMLRQAVEDFEQGREVFEALIGAYLAGDLDELERLAEKEVARMKPAARAHFRREGLVRRNLRMVERALPRLEQGGVLIAVGALHLPGDDGLIALLREHGYQVKPIY